MPPFDEPESIFPATEKVLFIGGPSHGQEGEVPKDEQSWRTFAKSSRPLFLGESNGAPALSTSGAVEVQTYYRRPLNGVDNNGAEYTRDVFVHESIPNPQIAQQALLAALLTRFIMAGRRIVDQDEPAG
jgi:hypothetical protein